MTILNTYALLKKKINLEFTFDKNFPFSGHKLLFKPTQITYKQPETLQNDDFLKKTFNFLAKNEGLKISKGFLSYFGCTSYYDYVTAA